MEITLKPCPHCDAPAKMCYVCGEYFVMCTGCTCAGSICDTEQKAADAWNRRIKK